MVPVGVQVGAAEVVVVVLSVVVVVVVLSVVVQVVDEPHDVVDELG